MELSKAKLDDAIEDLGIEFDYRGDYSGRFMYGANCFGIVGGVDTLVKFSVYIIGNNTYELDLLPDDWGTTRMDNMGVDFIFYWPDVQLVD